MNFVGFISFLDSTKEDRRTTVVEFAVIADWFISVTEFYRQEVMTGDYDGTEILINVFEFDQLGQYESDKLVETVSIMNPYYQ